MPEASRVFRKKMCYWSVADGEHSKQLQALVNSARRVGCREDFLVWSDVKIDNATVSNPCGKFSKENYLFKITFLLNEAVKYDYDYFCWLDADNYFVRKPRSQVWTTVSMAPMRTSPRMSPRGRPSETISRRSSSSRSP